jgi:S-adenosylmethionine:tRNA ribosyltransferase-isomerase
MNLTDLDFAYPEHLVATERANHSRVMWVNGKTPQELTLADLLLRFAPGDLLVINDTKVLRRRIFSESGLEILFLDPELASNQTRWRVLCPSSRWKSERDQVLPGGITLKLLSRGRPQVVESSRPLSDDYFEIHGEMPLPPYIQKARGERHNRVADTAEYQTSWAENPGSLAAPTASLHFTQAHLMELESRGISVARVTLHVGLGTFLPVTVENLEDHVMHQEFAEISAQTWQMILAAKKAGGKVWALGTTVTRTLEAAAAGELAAASGGGFCGETGIFIRPGFEFKVVDCLLTNFHQPQSTLFALVSAFSELELAKQCYAWAIERGFRLFSYGDLSVWTK